MAGRTERRTMERLVHLAWITFAEGPPRNAWDQDIIDVIAPETHFIPVYELDGLEGAVVVVPARYNVDHVPELNRLIRKLHWVVLVLTSDEESLFPWWNIHHPNIRIWVQSPRPDRHKNPSLRYLPVGSPWLGQVWTWEDLLSDRPQTGVFFHGQVNHIQRDEMVAAFKDFPDADVTPSPGFTQGLPRSDYLIHLAHSIVAPAPSGPASADSFRCWEALEMGAVPIVDNGPKPDPDGRALTTYPKSGFWELLTGLPVPFPVVGHWNEAPDIARSIIDCFPVENNRLFAWWQLHKRGMRMRLADDIVDLGGPNPYSDEMTVLMPTSPVPGNPSTDHIEKTISSVRERLPDTEILVMIDGVREELEHRRTDYEEYVRRLLWLCNQAWSNVTPIRFGEHLHQAEMTRRTINAYVRTPLILFVEHDTPLEGEIPWEECSEPVLDGRLDIVRFYAETVIQDEHWPLMGDQEGKFLHTLQWSQRPHIASTAFYAKMLRDHFSEDSRSMIEDVMHGVVQDAGWEGQYRLVIYNPGGNLKRSGHLDARGDDPKFEELFVR